MNISFSIPAAFFALAFFLLGCGPGGSETSGAGGGPSVPPAFPEDYASNYTEVRDCRQSAEHDLNVIRILADPTSLGPYLDRDAPFPEGAVVLKEEYDFGDVGCAGPIKQWTVMVRAAAGEASETLGWNWQRVDAERQVVEENEARCYGCHTGCSPAVGGFESTCAVP